MSTNKRLDDAGDREVDFEKTIVIGINNGISQGMNVAAGEVKKLQDGLFAGISQGIDTAAIDVKKLQDGLSAGISQGIDAAAREVKKLQDGLSVAEKLVRKAVTRITTGSQASDAEVPRSVQIKVKPQPFKDMRLCIEAERNPAANTPVIRRRN